MVKFARKRMRPNVIAPIRTDARRTFTYEGARALRRDPKSELFLLAVTNMVAERTFYEPGDRRDARFAEADPSGHGRGPGVGGTVRSVAA